MSETPTMPARRWHLLIDFIVAAGLVLTTATQLRPGALPIGPGEVILALWIVTRTPDIIFNLRNGFSRQHEILLYLMLPGLLVLVAGWFNAQLHPHWLGTSLRPVVALCFATLTVMALSPEPFRRLRFQRILVTMAGLSVLGLAVTDYFARSGVRAFGIDPLLDGTRFRGWAENPNQAALSLVWIPLFLLSMWRSQPSTRFMRIVIVCIFGLALWLGIETRSDALTVAWLAGAAWLVWQGVLSVLLSRKRHGAAKGMLGAAILIVLVSILWIGTTMMNLGEAAMIEMYKRGGQGALRLTLWKNGIFALKASPILGVGPGAHSGFWAPLQGHESHNTYIAWLSSTGLLGLLIVWLFVKRLFHYLSVHGNSIARAQILSLFVFGAFHNVYRHPMVWVVLLATLVLMPEGAQEEDL